MTTYHVDPTRPDNSGNGLSKAAGWKTLTYALRVGSAVVAGDTIELYSGNYDELIKCLITGTGSGAKITIVAHAGETPVFRGANGSQRIMEIINQSWIHLEGVTFAYNWTKPSGVNRFPWLIIQGSSCHDITIKDCNFVRTPSTTIADVLATTWDEWGIVIDDAVDVTVDGAYIRGVSQGVQIKNQAVRAAVKNSDIGYTYQSCIVLTTSDSVTRGVLIYNNELHHSAIEDGIQCIPAGSGTFAETDLSNVGTIILANFIHSNGENAIDTKGAHDVIIHGNTIWGTVGCDDGYSNDNHNSMGAIMRGARTVCEKRIIRFNTVYSNAGGVWLMAQEKVYNNTFLNNNRDYGSANSTFDTGSDPRFTGVRQHSADELGTVVLVNNIFAQHNDADLSLYCNKNAPGQDVDLANNLYASAKWIDRGPTTPVTYTTLANWKTRLGATNWNGRNELGSQTVANLSAIGFVDVPSGGPTGASSGYDFTLQSTSPAFEAGTWLTRVNGAATASTSIVLDDARVFTAWLGRTDTELPDENIYFGGSVNLSRRLLSLNYTTNTITVNSAITVPDNTPVYYGDSDRPHIGSMTGEESAPPPPATGAGGRVVTQVAIATSLGNQTATLPATMADAPQVWRFWGTTATATNTATNGLAYFTGFAWNNGGSAVNGAATIRSRHNVNPGDTSRRTSITKSLLMQDTTNGAVEADAEIVLASSNASQVTWNVTDAPPSAYLITAEAIECEDAYAGPFDIPQTLSSTVTITLSGWTSYPDIIYVITNNKGPHPTNNTHARMSYGIATYDGATITQQCYTRTSDDALSPTKVGAYLSNTYVAAECSTDGVLQRGLQITTVSSTQIIFTVVVGAYPDATADAFVVAIGYDGLSTYSGVLGTPTAATNPYNIDFGFPPGSAEVIATTLQSANTTDGSADAGAFGHGIWDGTRQYSVSVAEEDAQTTSDTQSLTDSKFINLPQGDGSTGIIASVTGTSGDNLQLNVTNTLAAARKYIIAGTQAQVTASIVTDFAADTVTPVEGDTATFTDASVATGTTITSRAWDFGDGDTSTATNPTHVYDTAGTYTVVLVTGDGTISDTETKTNYITVSAAPDPTPPTADNRVIATAFAPDVGISAGKAGAIVS